jgi:hypothetical protein
MLGRFSVTSLEEDAMKHDETRYASGYWENERIVEAREFDQDPGLVMDLAADGPVTVLDESGKVPWRVSLPSFDDL